MIDKKYFETHSFKDLEEVITAIYPFGNYNKLTSGYIFRGQKRKEFSLTPSVLRREDSENVWSLGTFGKPINNQSELSTFQMQLEYDLLKQFYDKSDIAGLYTPEIKRFRNRIHDIFNTELFFYSEEWLPDELVEIAGIAQHYGMQTRLLDWTYDYNIALYFAAIGMLDKESKHEDCILWALNYQFFNFLWDTVKRSPLNIIRPSYYGNPYLEAQKGVFTLWKERKESLVDNAKDSNILSNIVDRRPLDERISEYMDKIHGANESNNISEKLLYCFVIPGELKKDILRWLYSNGYSEEILFPGYHGVVKAIRNNALAKGI